MSTTPVVVDMTWPIYASDFTFRRHVALFRDLPPLIVPLAAANAHSTCLHHRQTPPLCSLSTSHLALHKTLQCPLATMATNTRYETLDHYTFDLRKGLSDAAKVGLNQLEDLIGDIGYGWLDGHMEEIMSRNTR